MASRNGGWAAFLAAGGAWLVAGDAFVYAPEAGTELERSWSETLALEVDSIEHTLGGNPIDLPFEAIEFGVRRSFELSDELEEVAGGRATSLVRGFSSSSLGFELGLDGEVAGLVEGQNSCDGAAVRFRWDEDEKVYERERLEGKLDDERLERLAPDLDGLALWPAGELEPGDDFEPALDAVRAFFHAGGDLGFTLRRIELGRDDVPAELMVAGALGSLHELFAPGSELSGTLEGRYAGREGEPGAELARLELELDLAVAADLGPRFRDFMKEATEGSHQLQVSAELEGELVCLWDVAARRPRSARFEGEVAMEGHLAFPLRGAAGTDPQEFVGDYELSGSAVVELVGE